MGGVPLRRAAPSHPRNRPRSDLRYVVEPERTDVFVGISSVGLVEADSFAVVPDPSGRPPQKVFDGTVEVSHI